jgi:hypothetical protein
VRVVVNTVPNNINNEIVLTQEASTGTINAMKNKQRSNWEIKNPFLHGAGPLLSVWHIV